MNNPEEKQGEKTTQPPKGCGLIALVCGILSIVVVFFGVYLSRSKDGVPFAIIYLCVLYGWTAAFIAIKNREYTLAILGILISLPAVAILFWYVYFVCVPFYVQWYKGGWYSIP